MKTKTNLSVIVPAYNEERVINETIKNLKKELNKTNVEYELVVVNDSSTDKTKEILEKISGIRLVNHPYNKGYGAAIKSGVFQAQGKWVMTFDSDGQHRAEDLKRLLEARPGFDMVIGNRQGYKGPAVRQPGKKLLTWIAEYLVKKKIPDLNSGLRLIKKEYFIRYSHLLPSGFSWTTTITLAFLKEGLNVNYAPIKIKKRQGGKSLVRPSDALKVSILILRIIMLFSPFRIFIPVSILLGLAGFISLVFDIIIGNLSDLTVLLFVSTILIFFFGLLADQVAAIRREMKK